MLNHNTLTSKFIIGTAQFGLDYGINNTRGKIQKDKVFKILDHAFCHGVRMLDTAFSYGDSEQVLGEYHRSKDNVFEVVSKIKPGRNQNGIIDESLNRLERKKIYGMMVHDFKSFQENNLIYSFLLDARDNGKILKCGFSVYYPDQIRYLFDNSIEFDFVQLPYSVLDQRFERLLPVLKSKGIEVHARSLFLQGLFFKPPQNLGGQFLPVKPKIEKLQHYAKTINVSLAAICINFALLNNDIDKIVVGVDSIENLKEDISALEDIDKVKDIYSELQDLKVSNNDIVLPFTWK